MDIMTKNVSYQIRQKTFNSKRFEITTELLSTKQPQNGFKNSNIYFWLFFANVPFSSQAYFMIDPKGGGQYDPLTCTGLEEFWTHLWSTNILYVSLWQKESIFLIRLPITCVTSNSRPLRGVYEIDLSLTFAEKKRISTKQLFFSPATHSVSFSCALVITQKTVASCDVPPFRVRWKRRLAVITDPTKIFFSKKETVASGSFS